MRVRPNGFVSADEVLDVIERSIHSVEEWDKKTNYTFTYARKGGIPYSCAERIEELQQIQGVIIQLKWRYGDIAKFQFTRRHIPNTISVSEIVEDVPEFWEKRILVDENIEAPRIYINF